MIIWKIKNAKRHSDTGLVSLVSIDLIAQNSDLAIEHQIDIPLPPKDAASADFVPFEQLTEGQLIDWAKQAMKPEGVAYAESDATVKLQNKANPIMADGTPWDLNTSKGT